MLSRASVTRPLRVFRAIAGQVPVQRLVDFADIGGAINHLGAVFLGMNVRAAQGVLVAEVADDFFEEVFQGGTMPMTSPYSSTTMPIRRFCFLEVDQLGRQRRAFRDEVGLIAGGQ